MILLNRTATEPLHEQLYCQIRDELKSGKFSDASSRLPSTTRESQDRRLAGAFRIRLNVALQKGWLDSLPDLVVWLMSGIPMCLWIYIGLTHDRFKNYLRNTRSIVAMIVFIGIGMILGGAIGGVAFMLYRRPANPQAHVPPATPLPFIGALHRTNEGVPSPSLATATAAHRIFDGVKAPQPGGRRAALS